MSNQITFTVGVAAQNWLINQGPGAQTMVTRSVLDTENLAYPVLAVVGGVSYNPTADAVQFAFMPQPANANPGTSDWHAGTWATTATGTYLAQVLVGPANGGVTVASGVYNVWIKITDSPEVPVRQIDVLTVI
jgi:hypothetical protein